MVDRIQFASSIDYTNSTQEKVVSNHFDEIMTLYNILGINNIDIQAFEHEGNIAFSIKTLSPEDARIVVNKLNDNIICKNYNKNFKLDVEILGCSINMYINENQ